MKKVTTRAEYARRIEKTIQLIWAEPERDSNLYELADAACFSPFHFHRLYREMCGETVAKTIKRMRLHRASAQLAYDGASLKHAATSAGYGSTEAFSRAFRQLYGTTPTQWHYQFTHYEAKAMYNVEICEFKERTLLAMNHRGPYMSIGSVFETLNIWAAGEGLVGPDHLGIGVFYDDPASVALENLNSHAGIVVTAKTEEPARNDISKITLAGGRHASVKHVGPYSELKKPYQWLYADWLPQSGEEPADRPCFEIYTNSPHDTPQAELETLICVPLK